MVALLYIFRVFFTSNKPFGGYFQRNACTNLQKICSPTKYNDAKLIKNNSKFYVTLLHFAIYRKTTKRPKFSEIFLPLIDPLVASFNEMRAPTSKENVAEQGILMPNCSKTSQTFKWHSSGLALEKQPKIVNFQSFFYI